MDYIDENSIAMRAGFMCHPDKSRGSVGCWYSKGNIYVWKVSNKWISAIIIDRMYSDQREFNTLEEALNEKHN